LKFPNYYSHNFPVYGGCISNFVLQISLKRF